jgi:hypothetical protein
VKGESSPADLREGRAFKGEIPELGETGGSFAGRLKVTFFFLGFTSATKRPRMPAKKVRDE